MQTIISLFLISFIVVFIIDISGVVDSVKSLIKRILTKGKMSSSDYRLKPFDCSLCSTFWCGLIYLLCVGQFTFEYIAFVCLLSASTDLIKDIWMLCEDMIKTIIKICYKVIDRI